MSVREIDANQICVVLIKDDGAFFGRIFLLNLILVDKKPREKKQIHKEFSLKFQNKIFIKLQKCES